MTDPPPQSPEPPAEPTTPLPPDRGGVATEQRNPRTTNLHALTAAECIAVIQREDHAVLAALDAARPSLVSLLEDAEPRFCRGGRLVYLGAGTSGRLGVLDASEAPPTFQVESGRIVGLIAGGDSALRKSSEHKEDDPQGAASELDALALTENDTVIGIAAGGSTPYVVGGLKHAHNRPAPPLTAMIACTPIAPQPFMDHVIVLNTGPEVLTGSTRMKAGTATKLALNQISTTLMIREGRVFENLMVDLRATNDKLRDRAARIVTTLTGLDRAAALRTIEDAGGSVKVAVAMARLGIDRPAAERRLAEARGRLGDLIGNHNNTPAKDG